MNLRPFVLAATAVASLQALPARAQSVIVNIDARSNLSYVAGGAQYLLPGTVAQPYNPVTITLDAGTYVISNNASSGYYSAWNFNGVGLASNSNWVWGFVMAEHGGRIIEDAYVDGILSSQAAVAAATGVAVYNGNAKLAATSTAGFTDTFTLTRTTTLDFYHDDYNWGGGDNYGGVSLKITSAVPEAGSAAMLAAGLLVLGACLRRRGQSAVRRVGSVA